MTIAMLMTQILMTEFGDKALILDDRLETIAFAEDVGRHNALDKAIGKAMMNGKISNANVLIPH